MKNTPSKTHVARYTSEDENFWRQHMAAFSACGISRATYCKQNGVDYHRLGYWTRKLSTENLQASKHDDAGVIQPRLLVPVQLKPLVKQDKDIGAVLCTLNMNNGHVLQVHSEQALSMLLERWS